MLFSHGEAEPGRISTWLAVRMKFNIGFMGARLSPNVMVKRGPLVTLEEGANVEYIREYTSIPVPKLHCAFTRKGCTYIVTEYIHGQTLWGILATGVRKIKRNHTASADKSDA